MIVFYLIIQLGASGITIPEPYPSRDACIEAAKTASYMAAGMGHARPIHNPLNFVCIEARKIPQ